MGAVAITAEQAEDLRALGVEPIEKKDGRRKDGGEHEAYEAEALGQGQITELLQTRLDDLLPEPLDDVQEREEEERQVVMDLLNGTG